MAKNLKELVHMFKGEVPVITVLTPVVIVFFVLCWLLAQCISWLGVIILFTGIHWVLSSKYF